MTRGLLFLTAVAVAVSFTVVHPAAAADAAEAKNVAAVAHDYPTKPVSVIEPFGAGGGPDLLARALAQKLSEVWGQPVTVENIPGAGATAGPARVAKSPADGYTLLINTSAQAYSAAVLNNLPYDPLKDFIPVVPLTSQPYVLVAGKSAGVTTVRELIAAAKAKPGELKFGSAGVATATHVGVEKFNQAAGIDARHVPALPTDSNANTIANAIAGRTTYYMAPISLALPEIHDGKLVALGVTTARRSTLIPEVPTIAEAGVAGFDFPIWYGIWAPTGTPAAVVNKLAKDFAQALAAPEMRDWLSKHGADPMSMTQPEFARFVLSESENAAHIIKVARTKPLK
ncbi:MAG TPA: tripartite tricarboxylate transporter substrate-binding protein [Candidatus Udaeobacter sp.]